KWLALKFANHMMMDPFIKKVLWDFWKKSDNQEGVIDMGFFKLEKVYISWYQEPKFLIKMPSRRNKNINDVREQEFEQRTMTRMEKRLDQFVDHLADRMNDIMNPRRRGYRNGRRSEGEESENPFFEGDGKGGFGGEEDSIEDVVVLANDLCSLMIQTTLSVDFEKDINTKSHELMPFGKIIIIMVSQSSFKFLIRKQYQEWYLKAEPMVDKFDFKTNQGSRSSHYKEKEFDAGIQI
nr:reverse transcriptase domain-containing protein [Tanacetum cinerariifolium]